MNIVDHGHQYVCFDNMDMKDVIGNHKDVNKAIDYGDGILKGYKDTESETESDTTPSRYNHTAGDALRDARCRGGCGPAARVQWLDVGGALGRLHSVVATRDDV